MTNAPTPDRQDLPVVARREDVYDCPCGCRERFTRRVVVHASAPRPPGAAGVMRKWITVQADGRWLHHEQPYERFEAVS